jgi:hypothetical protein
MGKINVSESVLLFVGTLYADSNAFVTAGKMLTQYFGDILLSSSRTPWNHSSYYKDELGWPIYRQFIFFRNLVDPGNLADIKIKTNELEYTLSIDGKRSINLDPGYLALSKIVLASTKNYAHRVYLGKGIYAEVTLVYKNNSYAPHLFTYRDYQEKTSIDIFIDVREKLREITKENST